MLYALNAFVATVLAALGGPRVYWALEGGWATGVTVPEAAGVPAFTPSLRTTVAVALFVAAATVYGRLGVRGSAVPGWVFF
jgi:hypothetical protein